MPEIPLTPNDMRDGNKTTLESGSDESPGKRSREAFNGLHIKEVHKSLVGKIDKFGFVMSPGTSDGIMYYDLKDTELVLMLLVSKNRIVTQIEFRNTWPTSPGLKPQSLTSYDARVLRGCFWKYFLGGQW